jgi:hypothetical protein
VALLLWRKDSSDSSGASELAGTDRRGNTFTFTDMKRFFLLAAWLLVVANASAQLAVTVSPVKIAGQKAIVPLALRNNSSQKIESARAAVFLLDEQGKMIGQASRWVIGGSQDKPGLAAGATNAFHFVVAADKPLTTTNLTAKVTFNRVLLEGGKAANAAKDVVVTSSRR